MRRPSSWRALAFGQALSLAFPLLLVAQTPNTAPQQQAQPQSANTAKDPGTKKVLNLPDYGRWNRIVTPSISGNGQWVAYAFQPNDGDPTLYVKQLDGDKQFTVPVGSAPQFSDDSRWVGYFVSPPERAAGRAGRGGPQGTSPGQGRFGAAGAATAQRKFELLDLASGDKFDVPNAATFKFSKGSRYVAVRTNKAVATDTTHDGTDLVLRELASGMTRNIGNVNLYDFDDAGRLFAYTVDASGRVGNGIYLVDLSSGETKLLSGANADFDALSWSDEGSSLAVLRGDKPKDKTQRENTLLAWTDLGTSKSKAITFDPAKDAGFPKDMVLSEFTTPRWSKDGSRLFVGLKEQDTERAKSDSAQANVDVWHWKDAEPQSVQIVRIQQERRATFPAALLVAANKIVRLGDDAMRNVTYTQNGRWGIGRDDSAYRGEVAWGGSHADYYRVNTETGERTLIAKKLVRTMGISPDSKWFLYLRDKHLEATNLETMKTVDLDNGEKLSWVDTDDDHPYEKPVYGIAGWSKDGKSVLVYGKFDVWQLALDGSKATNLTQNVGDAQQIEFRVVRLDRVGGRGGRGGGGAFGVGGANDDDEGIDLTKPLLLSAYGEWTKKTGYYTLTLGRAPQPLVYADKQIGQAQKAQNADRVLFTEQTFTEFPDLWVSNTAFATPKKITDANPQISEYAWGSKRLIDYTNSKGQHLQATLTLPANYDPTKKYPMLVYFYEIMSNTHHQFSMPVYDDRPHISTYASNGYIVLQPDVVYEIGKPGTSAVDCVESAVKKVIEMGIVDPKHIGLQGHSWGGYQSSYILTRSKLFAAVVTGAPPTNLISFYDETYPGTGTLQQGIMELGQVRMGEGVTPWTAHDLYEDQSPIFHVRDISTPFMILHGTADNAVDWHQGLEFYGAARRWGKSVILLSYPGEPHHLARKENQKDFQIRMKQFFDHYLKDAPAPKWMTDGVPQTRKGAPIE